MPSTSNLLRLLVKGAELSSLLCSSIPPEAVESDKLWNGVRRVWI